MTPQRLKDLRFDLEEFDWQGTILNQPRFRIEAVNYHAPTMTAMIEIRFRENKGEAHFEHAQQFAYQLPEGSEESISAENIQSFISQVFPNASLVVSK